MLQWRINMILQVERVAKTGLKGATERDGESELANGLT